MSKENDIIKIERRAKALLLDKNIPPGKMELVKSLLENETLHSIEKYSAIIDIIQGCSDKPVNKLDTTDKEKNDIKNTTNTPIKPSDSSLDVDRIYQKYKKLKLFNKRYLIRVNNRLGIGIKKRLIPSKRLFKLIRDIIAFQEKVLSRLPTILLLILKDQEIEDATHFNYLRIFRRWMLHAPLIKFNLNEIKWKDRILFESEFKSYIENFYSFIKLNIETKEQIMLVIENQLRKMDDLKKEDSNQETKKELKIEKEKRNYQKEKIIYEYITIIRSFLPSTLTSESFLSNHFRLNNEISSFPEFLVIIMEALVFQREISAKDIISYYKITPMVVSDKVWDYSIDFLKKVGKDPASYKNKQIQVMKDELSPYNEIYSLLRLEIGGQKILFKAFEDQWKLVDKRHKDFGNIYEDNFLEFIDVCINYFNNSFISLIDGSTLHFEDKNEQFIEGNIFHADYFSEKLKNLSEILGEIHHFKSNNPRLIVKREEVIKILAGKIRSMNQINKIIKHIGDIFYHFGKELHYLYGLHKKWVFEGSNVNNPAIIRNPLEITDESKDNNSSIKPIPFYDCKITGFEKIPSLSKQLIDRKILVDSLKGGIIIQIMAFSYQLAFECKEKKILKDLNERANITGKIKEIME